MNIQRDSGGNEVRQDQQLLTFTLGGEFYGIPIDRVREILEYSEPTTIPMMPAFLRGVINLRGAVVPILDLQSRFGRQPTEVSRRSCFVIVEIEHDGTSHSMGILVDAVIEVLSVDRTRIEPKPTFGARIRPDFLEGILNLDSGFVLALSLNHVLSIEEMATLIGLASNPGDPR